MWRSKLTRFIKTHGHSASVITRTCSGQYGAISVMDVSAEVRQALHEGKPVIALESTIISHGMPWPDNLETALAVESVVRNQNVVPATVAILSGRIKVGLSSDELEVLAKPRNNSMKPPPLKVSRRDISYALANELDGGTTVAGTMIAANMAGISLFATGGIGGVHRGGEYSMDVSADLVELGRTPVSVVCAGVKSILDIERTLEYLETQGVPVSVLGESNLFPAFYARSHAGLKAPQHLKTIAQAAKLIAMSKKAQLRNGHLIAVPVPEEFSMDEKQMDEAINAALNKAEGAGVRGKDVTPFLLQSIKEITQGRSLATNIALVKNNAKVGAQIAVKLAILEKAEKLTEGCSKNQVKKNQETIIYHDQKRYQHTLSPVVVGGSNADVYIKVLDPEIKLDGSTLSCSTSEVSGGGVARNIAEAMHKLGATPKLISAIGSDANGRFLDTLLPQECTRTVKRSLEGNTASCAVILDAAGECKLFLGDMKMHEAIDVDLIKKHESVFEEAQMVILDSNIPLDTMEYVVKTAQRLGKPVFYEPTDMRKASRILEFSLPEPLAFCTPNLAELREMANTVTGKNKTFNNGCLISEIKTLCSTLIFENIIDVIVVTLGEKGVAVARRSGNLDNLFDNNGIYIRPSNTDDQNISIRLYPPAQLPENISLENTSGAGDCFAAGFSVAVMYGLTVNKAVAAGTMAAGKALLSNIPVPEKLFNISKDNWKKEAKYEEL